MRYLPSFVVCVTLFFAMTVVDRAQVRYLEQEKHHNAEALLFELQGQIDTAVSTSLRSVRRLATRINPTFDIDQQAFADLVTETAELSGEIVRVELAPGFVTRLVHPPEGNEHLIGRSPLINPDSDAADPAATFARSFQALAKGSVSEDGKGELEIWAGVQEPQGANVVTTGIVYLVVEFTISAAEARHAMPAGEFDIFTQFRPINAPSPEVPPTMQAEGNFEPLKIVSRYPPGDFLLYLRPHEGWQPTAAKMAPFRIRLLLLSLLILVPVILANWIAIRHAAARSDLTQAQNQMNELLQSLPGSAFTYTVQGSPGPDDRVKFLNPESSKKIWGIDAELAERDASAMWDRVETDETRATMMKALEQSMRDMSLVNLRAPIVTPEGEHKVLKVRSSPVRQADGSIRWTVLVIDDTEQFARETELTKQREMAYRAQKNESIGQLTGGVAHDFNNLLAVIVGNLELALENNEDAKERNELITAALAAAWRSGELVKKMLAFARQSSLDPVVLDINNTVRETERWLVRTIPTNIEIETNLQSRSWRACIDQAGLQSAIVNTVLNARDSMPAGGKLTIETSNLRVDQTHADDVEDDVPPGRYVMLAITDTGVGMDEETLQKVFDPFFTTKGVGMGSGLGLSMVQGFVKQSGGFVRIYSEAGVGTSIKMYFPVADGEAHTPPKPDNEAQEPDAGGTKILLVDDQPEILEVLKRTLTIQGYAVDTANNGAEALKTFETHGPYDLLITDIVMPGKPQGPELARKLRETATDLPAIFMSGYASEATVHGNGLRVEDIRLMKPVARAELVHAVEKALSLGQSPSG